MNETITASEALNGFWILFLTSFRGLLLILTGVLHTFARILFTLVRGILTYSSRAHVYIKDWQPIIPEIFDTPRMRELRRG